MIRSLLATGLCLLANIGVACDLGGSKLTSSDSTSSNLVELESGVILHYRSDPTPLPVAQHFSMHFLVCRGEQSLVPDAFKLDARMPTHGHGMNYKANIEIQHDGLVAATGMLFHMPGSWQIRVDLSYDGLGRQVKIDYRL
jgi:hypothetical protein